MTQTRRMKILQAVVEDYIRTQEPVSSSGVASRHHIDVSPATVRNDMAVLEEEGYLTQPHTSAGRIPSEKGYRYFVDQLSSVVPLSQPQRRAIEEFLKGSVNVDDVLHRSAQLLARITGQVAVVAAPAITRSTLRHCELLPVSHNAVLVVIITDTGRIEQRTLSSPLADKPDFLRRLMAQINDVCGNSSIQKAGRRIRSMDMELFMGSLFPAESPDASQHAARGCIEGIADIFDDVSSSDAAYSLYTTGASKLAHERNSQVENIAALLDALEEQIVVMHLMDNLASAARANRMDGVGIAIGSETHMPGLLHTAVVTSGYGVRHDTDSAGPSDNDSIAFVGSIGPTHMDYRITISAVRAVAQYLTRFMGNDQK
ncbi:MAG: heat-inducible transcriptional repressor HrcA [Scardovia wiggsiae]|uniref:heat-inducible transcriptional repressor HrcA n=1 Tax=Scardovia wiggsiae TaxID=230143 RepID=UPI00360E8BE9